MSTTTEGFYKEFFAQGIEVIKVTSYTRISASQGLQIPHVGYVELQLTALSHTWAGALFIYLFKLRAHLVRLVLLCVILGDLGADSGGERKSKRAEKYGTKISKERREESLGAMSYQTSSKRSQPFWMLIGARKRLCYRRSKRLERSPVYNLLSSHGILAVLAILDD